MSANSPDARIDFTKKDSEKIDTIHNLIVAYDSESSGLREEVRLLNEFSKKKWTNNEISAIYYDLTKDPRILAFIQPIFEAYDLWK